MAKTIIAQSGDIVNYDNIIAIYTDAEKRLQNDDSITVEYYVKADSANCTYTLGIYETEEEAKEVVHRFVAWLQNEIFGVYNFNTDAGGD
jgi:hypothetical protein